MSFTLACVLSVSILVNHYVRNTERIIYGFCCVCKKDATSFDVLEEVCAYVLELNEFS